MCLMVLFESRRVSEEAALTAVEIDDAVPVRAGLFL